MIKMVRTIAAGVLIFVGAIALVVGLTGGFEWGYSALGVFFLLIGVYLVK